MGKELVIKISGDVENYKAALRSAEKETEALSETAADVSKVAGLAFAALTAEIFFSVEAFNKEARAVNEVSQALQNQGLYTDSLAASYKKVAEEIEKKTGVDADSILSATAAAQATVGQIQLTEELTKAVVDFAAKNKQDVSTSYDIVAKAIQGNVGALTRYGIKIDEGLSKQERLAQIQDKLTQSVGGFAEAAARAPGSTILLTSAIENLQKGIGSRLAPAFDAVVGGLTKFINLVNNNKVVLDFAVSILAGATAAAGTALALGTLTLAYTKIRAVIIATTAVQAASNLMFGVAAPQAVGSLLSLIPALIAGFNGLSLATRVLVGSTGIGLLVLIITEVYLNWNTIIPRLINLWLGFVEVITGSAKALGNIIAGVFTGNTDRIKEGIDQWTKAYKDGYAKATAAVEEGGPKGTGTTQNPEKSKAAAARTSLESDQDKAAVEQTAAKNKLIQLENEKASKGLIDLKKQEIEILGKLEEEGNAKTREALHAKLDENRRLQEEQLAEDKERRTIANEELLAENEEFQQLTDDQKREFLLKNQGLIDEQVLTERTAREEAAKLTLEHQIKTHNQFLLEQQKFGVAYATINKAMHSEVYQGTKSAFGELAALQDSNNSTLKTIGKVAAIANIVIKSSEAAMNIYAGFSAIPIIGPALGIAGAAAAIAFGVEQIGRVKGAKAGGLLTGGVPGMDSIPVLAQQGELVAPTQNFEEVIGSVRAGREAEKFQGGGNDPVNGSAAAEMVMHLKNIEDKILTLQPGNSLTVEGDFVGNETYVDLMLRQLSDAIQYRNGKLFGVNS